MCTVCAPHNKSFRAKLFKLQLKMTQDSRDEEMRREAAAAISRMIDMAGSLEEKLDVFKSIMVALEGKQSSPRLEPVFESESDEEPEEEEPATIIVPNRTPPSSPNSSPRLARVAKLREMLHPHTHVDDKGKRGFDDVEWQELKSAYEVKCRVLEFTPTPAPMEEEYLRTLMSYVDAVTRTSDRDPMLWDKGTVTDLAVNVFRYAVCCVQDAPKEVRYKVTMSNEELNVNGCAGALVTVGSRRLAVVECKKAGDSYSKGLAQVMLEAETVLASTVQEDEASTGCVYGLLATPLAWTWVRLDRDEARFCFTSISPQDIRGSLKSMASIANGIVLGLPINTTSATIAAPSTPVNTGKRARRS